MARLKGSEILAKSLAARGVEFVFTVPAPGLTPLINALEKQENLTVIQARDETAAAIMADGYVRRSRSHAAVLTGSSGRSLSQISGVTNAWADKSPLLSISLCEDTPPAAHKGALRRRFNQGAVYAPVVSWRGRLKDPARTDELVARALASSVAGKMGPVHLDVPKGFLSRTLAEEKVEIAPYAGKSRIQPLRIPGDRGLIRQAAAMIKRAERPLVMVGGGVRISGAEGRVKAFMEAFHLPAATTMAGIGSVSADHPLCLGGPSYTAGEVFHEAISSADLVIALGFAFGGLEGFGKPPLWSDDTKFIQVDIDPSQVGLNVFPEVCLAGDAKTVITQLHEALADQGFSGKKKFRGWTSRLAGMKADRKKRLEKFAMRPWSKMHQGRLVMEMGRAVDEDTLLVIDGGNTPLYASMYGPGLGPNQAFFPFGMAALGGGLPYAIGVALADPGKRVALFTGDGSFMYAVSELETMVRLKLPIHIFVNNDSAWNMVKAVQDSFFECNYVGSCLPDIDYSAIARGMGLFSQRVTRPESVFPAFEKALEAGGPTLMDCVTDDRNMPDTLLSFALVEFEGSFTQLNPKKALKGLWMGREKGLARNSHMAEYALRIGKTLNP